MLCFYKYELLWSSISRVSSRLHVIWPNSATTHSDLSPQTLSTHFVIFPMCFIAKQFPSQVNILYFPKLGHRFLWIVYYPYIVMCNNNSPTNFNILMFCLLFLDIQTLHFLIEKIIQIWDVCYSPQMNLSSLHIFHNLSWFEYMCVLIHACNFLKIY